MFCLFQEVDDSKYGVDWLLRAPSIWILTSQAAQVAAFDSRPFFNIFQPNEPNLHPLHTLYSICFAMVALVAQ